LSEDQSPHFRAVNRHAPWGIDSEPDYATDDRQHRQEDAVADDDLLALPT